MKEVRESITDFFHLSNNELLTEGIRKAGVSQVPFETKTGLCYNTASYSSSSTVSMKALLLKGKNHIVYGDYPMPKIGPDEVLLRVHSVGICGTDLHIYHGGLKVKTPIMGHEFSGVVAAVGSKVKDFEIGNRVVGEHVLTCGKCVYCLRGQPTLCLKSLTIGMDRPGALAEYLAIPAGLVYKIPGHLTFDEAAMIEPLTIALYAVHQAGPLLDKTAVVIGQGPIGLLLDQVLKAGGATVVGLDVQASRLAFAKKHRWLDETINPAKQSPLKAIKKYTADGADLCFEAVGREATVELALDLARRDGNVYLLGVFEQLSKIDLMQVVTKELNIFGSWRCAFSFPEALGLVAKKKIDLKSLVTHRYAARDGATAFADADRYANNRIKTVIYF
ncbi:MAG: alcohol dehydrogenase catalytic domain-containing protein [Patescibacteria group bacterium]